MFIRTPVAELNSLEGARTHHFGLDPARWKRLGAMRVWITGAGSGFGQSIALALMAAGAETILTGRNPEKLWGTLARAAGHGFATHRATLLPLDLRDPVAIAHACREVSLAGPLDGLVHSAAVPSTPGAPWPATGVDLEAWSRTLDTNVRAPWLLTCGAFESLRASQHPRVVMLGSEAGWAGTYRGGLYNLSKAALNSLVQTLAHEYEVRAPNLDMQLNLLVPGEAHTEMNANSPDSSETVISMCLTLLSQGNRGPNGRFFHRDGRHFSFGYTRQYGAPLTDQPSDTKPAEAAIPAINEARSS